jgi:HD-like signal output (HDOD) protein
MVVAYGAAEAFREAPKHVVDLERFWEYSIQAALIGKYLGQVIGIKQSEPLYLSGLLHNIGELVVAEVNPEVASHCDQFHHGILPWQQQQKLLGFCYNECSAALLSLWQLPNNLVEPIRFIHQAAEHPDSRMIQLLHISSRLALLNAASDTFVINELLDMHLVEALSLTRSDLEEARAFASLESLSILSLLNPKSSMIL